MSARGNIIAYLRRHLKEICLISLTYLIITAVYAACGVRFYIGDFFVNWHHIDVYLLRHDLWRSLFYLHSQPPLFNLYLGVGLKYFGGSPYTFYNIINHAFGFALYASLYVLMRQLVVGYRLSFFLATLFAASPSFVLYENYLTYTPIVAAAICISAVQLNRFVRTRNAVDGSVFFLLISILCGTWAMFHLAFFILVVAGVLCMSRIPTKTVITAMIVPLLLVTSIYVKNEILFGDFTASSWTGMNAAYGLRNAIPERLRAELVSEKKLSPLSSQPFRPLNELRNGWFIPKASIAVPVVCDEFKSSGAPNFNNQSYITVSRQCLKDSEYLVLNYPKAYLHRVLLACGEYFIAADDYWVGSNNLERTRLLRTICDRCLGVISKRPGIVYQHDICFMLLLLYPVVLGFCATAALRKTFKQRFSSSLRPISILYPLSVIMYIMVVSSTINMYECNRMRFTTDALFVALLGFALQSLISTTVKSAKRSRLKSTAGTLASSMASSAATSDS